ncbi:hypothetical protein JYU34_015069 [Plutella xylostella]|uniref:MADF domain-containing protein n=1 Tax=Plutella xylostella TaxID=51655 RepID=A0ABQ7Q9X4_PLUXY|nr:hypothetical protein JYU34_015069 [Plutella xylostella]
MATAWPHSEILKFLEYYRAETIIWNPKHKNHKDKNKVSDAWNRISNNMGIPVEDLKKKKETLMTAFRTNLKKKKESIRSGAGLDDIYTPSWPFFEIMESFLRDVYECKSIINTDGGASTSLDDEDSITSQNENIENEDPNATVNSEINIPVIRRRSRNPPELQEASNEMKRAFSSLNSVLSSKKQKIDSEDDCDLYGKLLAKRLRQFTDLEKQELMYEIDGLLLKKRQLSSRQNSSRYVVQSPSQIIISSNRPVSGRTCTSTPLVSEEQNYSYRPSSSFSTYSTSSYHPPSVTSPPYFSPSPNATPDEFPVISIPEQPNLHLQSHPQSQILQQALNNANII